MGEQGKLEWAVGFGSWRYHTGAEEYGTAGRGKMMEGSTWNNTEGRGSGLWWGSDCINHDVSIAIYMLLP